jgi:hypothetical protein
MREINRSHSNNPIKKEEFCLTKQAIINHYFSGVLLHKINKTSLTIYFKKLCNTITTSFFVPLLVLSPTTSKLKKWLLVITPTTA